MKNEKAIKAVDKILSNVKNKLEGTKSTYLCVEHGEEFTVEEYSMEEAIEAASLYGGVVIRKLGSKSAKEEIAKPVKKVLEITIKDYPKTIKFPVSVKLPPFKYGCKVRAKLARKCLEKTEYDTPHDPCDFVIERVDVVSGGEVWHLGS
jgi:hypothetical protein